MKNNSLLIVVGVIALGSIGFIVYQSIKNARNTEQGK
jgi:preprotein translocase subunit Sss1